MRGILKMVIIGVIAIFVSILVQFGYNMLFVKPYEPKLTKGGDGKLTQMLYESEFWKIPTLRMQHRSLQTWKEPLSGLT